MKIKKITNENQLKVGKVFIEVCIPEDYKIIEDISLRHLIIKEPHEFQRSSSPILHKSRVILTKMLFDDNKEFEPNIMFLTDISIPKPKYNNNFAFLILNGEWDEIKKLTVRELLTLQ